VARESWQQKKLWEKRIWVDFDNDIILLDTMARRNIMPAVRELTALGLLTVYAGDEAKKIKRLAVGGNAFRVFEICNHLHCTYDTGSRAQPICIEEFENITELLVDDSFRSPILGNWPPWVGIGPLPDREVTKRKILNWYHDASRDGKNWKFLGVRTIRQEEWYELGRE
jgi:hypothetical protein